MAASATNDLLSDVRPSLVLAVTGEDFQYYVVPVPPLVTAGWSRESTAPARQT